MTPNDPQSAGHYVFRPIDHAPVHIAHDVGFFTRIGLTARKLWPAIADLAGNDVYVLASAIAFNALLSFFPFAILLLVVCRGVLDWREGYEVTLLVLRDSYLPVAQDFIVQNLRVLTSQYGRGGGIALASLATLAFTSSGIFAPLELALDRAWKVPRPRSMWRSRGLAMALTFGCGALMLGSVTIAAFIRDLVGPTSSASFRSVLALIVTKLLTIPITIAVFFLVYYFLPNRRVPVLRVLPAAIYIGILWEMARYCFIWCLPLLKFESVYGPFYVTVTLVMWAFVSSLLLLLGANLSAIDVSDQETR